MTNLEALLAAPGTNPFVTSLTRALVGWELEPETVPLAASVAAWPADLTAEERQVLTLTVLASWLAIRRGSTRITVDARAGTMLDLLDTLIDRARQEGAPDLPSASWWTRSLESLLASGRAGALVGAPGETRPLIWAPPHLYLHRSLFLEERFVEGVAALSGPVLPGPDPDAFQNALSDVIARPPILDGQPVRHTQDQLEAIVRAADPGLTVITGGPGTGKTSILVSVLRVLARCGVAMNEVALVAPTGKAAQRMRQTIERSLVRIENPAAADEALRSMAEPATLHRLLGFSPSTGRFRHHENNRLPHSRILVDEASMIDLSLAERLVRSIRPGSGLVLLGDDRQLPSVDMGQPLRDLVSAAPSTPSLATRVVRLTRTHRHDLTQAHGAALHAAAESVRGGVFPPVVRRASARDVTFEGLELLAPAAHEREDLLLAWYDRFLRAPAVMRLARRQFHQGAGGFPEDEVADLEKLFNHLDRFRVLCYTHAYDEGTERINEAFHQRSLSDAGSDFVSDFHPGEPVVMLANDYERGVFNGDTGVVLRVSQDGGPQHFMLVFRRATGFVAFHVGSLRERVRHAFALTVHKAQGSEHDHVLVIMPAEDLPMNSRELIYTALTRARRSVTVLGSPEHLARGIAREVRRDTGVPARLEQALLGPVAGRESPR